VGAPVGPTGCEGNYQARPERAWILGAALGAFDTELIFEDDTEPDITEISLVASGGYRWGEGWSARLAAGAVLAGTIEHDGRTHEVGAGWVVAASLSRSFTFAGRWFAAGSVTAGFSSISTEEDLGASMGERVDLMSGDVRLGVIAGVTLWERVSPYAQARAFGGPVMWTLDGQDITGTDQHHYQLGLGVNASLPWDLSALLDVSVLGERALSIGVSAEL